MSTVYRCLAASVAAAALSLLAIPAATTPALCARRASSPFNGEASAGTIVVRTNERRLYLVLGQGRAMALSGRCRPRRPAVGRRARSSTANTSGRPGRRRPTSQRDHPGMPDVIPGGSPSNPMGVAAMTLSGGDYAIHGTNNPGSIGGFVSYGCIRMYNQDITDLYDRVSVGTPVIVTR